MNITIYDKSSGEILRTMSIPAEMVGLQCSNDEGIVFGPHDGDKKYVVNESVHDYTAEEVRLKGSVPYGYKWKMPERSVMQILSDEQISDYHSNQARAKRNQLIAQTDWTQGYDIPQEVKAVWAPYRQALRDITTQKEFPLNIVWPDLPQ